MRKRQIMAHEAGKGDKRRPTNEEIYQQNFDNIFRKPTPQAEAVVAIQQLEHERLSGKNTTEKSLDKD